MIVGSFLRVVGGRVAVFVLGLIFMLSPLSILVSAETLSTGWLASGSPEIKFANLPLSYAIPHSPNYNTDCDTRHFDVVTREAQTLPVYPYTNLSELRHASTCAVQTPRGMHDGEYLAAGVPAGKFSTRLLMVPNSTALVSMGTGATNLDRSISFYDTITPAYSNLTKEVRYDLVGHQYMMDQTGRKVYVRSNSIGFSSDGRWMVAEAVNGFVRVDLHSREVLRFTTNGLTYGSGTNPQPRVAISPDGRYVAVASRNTIFKVYDLNTCSPTPDIVFSPITCQFKDIEPFLSQTFPVYAISYYIRFASPSLLTFVTEYTDTFGVLKRASVRMSPSGQPIEDVSYLALGDSFSSGEGLREVGYILGTDEDGFRQLKNEQGFYEGVPRNKCHLSSNSYPYLVARSLAVTEGFHNVACSGATTSNYTSRQRGQERGPDSVLGVWTPGYRSQKEQLDSAKPSVVTMSMIGNDIGFSNKIKRCIGWSDSCFHFKEDRESIAREIYSKFDTLVDLYEAIQEDSENAKLYVLGYPQLVATGECGVNVSLDLEERRMARGMVTYLNAVIKAATKKSGVQYIDVENVFAGHQLCESGEKAVNGLTAGDDTLLDQGPVGNESFHPNELGHGLMAQALLEQSDRFTKPMRVFDDPEHAVDPTVLAPYVGSEVYDALLGSAPSGGTFSRATYTTLNALEFVVQGVPFVPVSSELLLRPNSNLDIWLNSTPTHLGTLLSDELGRVTGEVSVPTSVSAGYHTLHLYGQNFAGQQIDLYKTIYVAASETDIDGDGVPNSQEKCLAVEPSNTDDDQDGIDDACDAEIAELPADMVAPIVTGTPDREPNEHGWYNGDVTINWSVTDPEPSSGVPTQPPAIIANEEGVHFYSSDLSCDPLGNCTQGNLELKIDKIAPDITYTITPSPAASGWNNSEAIVTFTCDDTTSGVAECTEPQTVTGQDGVYVVTGYATDKAGNTNAVNVFVSLDSTKPTITQSVYPVANVAGWHNTDVTVTPVCDDNLSSVLVCGPSVALSTEGANQVVVSDAVDGAGNTASVRTSINIDKTAPILGVAAWSNNPKSVVGTATITVPTADNLSGIAEAEYYLGDADPGIGNGATMHVYDGIISVGFNADFPTGVYKVTMRAKDKAGNWSAPVSDYLVVYDPFGTRMTGKRTLLPSLAGGDILPGLVTVDQTDKAKFGFNVRYDKDGRIHKHSDFQFKYETGQKCSKPTEAKNCHLFELNASSITWLTTQGDNDSMGIFEGSATLKVDGVPSNVIFRLTGLDGERLNSTGEDHLTLKIYTENTDPNSALPLYAVEADVARGNIKIYK